MKPSRAIILSSALLFSVGAFAQSTHSDPGPNMQKTPDGVTPTPDATSTPTPSKSRSEKHMDRQDKKNAPAFKG
ncbi:MAG TPA: hypothetical protein VN114_04490 [Oxalicibacterium sp.]|uniref:hypothetical protein n=1 Tax=Oxalicibacterium sp. TaxID=2766525 RepID=UPI002C885F70|nr:hypothetical protein [Oxalicibacterium sp.]HWU97751.1 hypothetical protein [Oxalicibacterium sp.]